MSTYMIMAGEAYEDGPYREWKEPDVYQALSISTDSNSLFLNLAARQDCHVIFISRVAWRPFNSHSVP